MRDEYMYISINQILLKQLNGELNTSKDWNALLTTYRIPENILDKFYNNFYEVMIYNYQKVSINFINKHLDNLSISSLEAICKRQKINEQFIRLNQSKFDSPIWAILLKRYQIPINILNKNLLKYTSDCWINIVRYQKVDEDFLIKNKHYIQSIHVFKYRRCSDTLIETFLNLNDSYSMEALFKYQHISEELMNCILKKIKKQYKQYFFSWSSMAAMKKYQNFSNQLMNRIKEIV